MSLIVSLYVAILFFVLTPGILLTLPKGGSKFKVAAVHALVFALLFHFTYKLVWRIGASLEGMTAAETGQTYYSDATCHTVADDGEYVRTGDVCIRRV